MVFFATYFMHPKYRNFVFFPEFTYVHVTYNAVCSMYY